MVGTKSAVEPGYSGGMLDVWLSEMEGVREVSVCEVV